MLCGVFQFKAVKLTDCGSHAGQDSSCATTVTVSRGSDASTASYAATTVFVSSCKIRGLADKTTMDIWSSKIATLSVDDGSHFVEFDDARQLEPSQWLYHTNESKLRGVE